MSTQDPNTAVDQYGQLIRRLSQIAEVERHSRRDNEQESETLAHALVDINEICQRVTGDIMPRLTDTSATDADIVDALSDLGELFREFLYHVRDPYYFRYLPGCEDGNDDA